MLGARIDNAVIVVGNRNNPRPEGNVYAFESFGITGAVPVFMMRKDNFHYMGKLRYVFQHARSGEAVISVGGVFTSAEIGIFA